MNCLGEGSRRCCFPVAVCTIGRCEREGGKKGRAMKTWKAAGGLVLHGIEYTGAGTTQALNSRARSSHRVAWMLWCEHGMMTGTGNSSTHRLRSCSNYELICMVRGIDRSRPVGPIHLKMVESSRKLTLDQPSPSSSPTLRRTCPWGSSDWEPPTSAPRHCCFSLLYTIDAACGVGSFHFDMT
jgi:hypothetical protein